jgi:hypothetical protein
MRKSVRDIARAFNDVENYLNEYYNMFKPAFNVPGSGELKFLVAQDNGTVALWTLVAGAGVTLAFNTSTQECTITSP